MDKEFWKKFFALSLIAPFCGFFLYLIWLGGNGFNLNDLKDFALIELALWLIPMIAIYAGLEMNKFTNTKDFKENGKE